MWCWNSSVEMFYNCNHFQSLKTTGLFTSKCFSHFGVCFYLDFILVFSDLHKQGQAFIFFQESLNKRTILLCEENTDFFSLLLTYIWLWFKLHCKREANFLSLIYSCRFRFIFAAPQANRRHLFMNVVLALVLKLARWKLELSVFIAHLLREWYPSPAFHIFSGSFKWSTHVDHSVFLMFLPTRGWGIYMKVVCKVNGLTSVCRNLKQSN